MKIENFYFDSHSFIGNLNISYPINNANEAQNYNSEGLYEHKNTSKKTEQCNFFTSHAYTYFQERRSNTTTPSARNVNFIRIF